MASHQPPTKPGCRLKFFFGVSDRFREVEQNKSLESAVQNSQKSDFQCSLPRMEVKLAALGLFVNALCMRGTFLTIYSTVHPRAVVLGHLPPLPQLFANPIPG